MLGTANDVACDPVFNCYVFNITATNGPGVGGDVFEISISFGDVALQLGPVVDADVAGGISKVPPTPSSVSYTAEMALTDEGGVAITPLIPLLSDTCDALFGCSFGGFPGGPTPEFGNVLAYGAFFRLTTSGSSIPIIAGVSSAAATPIVFRSAGAFTVPVPEPGTLSLAGFGLVLMAIAHLHRRRSTMPRPR